MTEPLLSQFNNITINGLKFCDQVYNLFESISKEPHGISGLRTRKLPLHKKLTEELIPIANYIQANYMLGRYIDVKWVDGNQNFDAEIFQSGFYIDKNYFSSHHYLEVTIAEHPNEYLSREILDIEGGAFSVEGLSRNKDKKIISGPVVNDGDDFIKNFSDILVQRITNKASKSYPEGTSLIIYCNLNSLYFLDEWNLLINIVKKNSPKHNFNEIFICSGAGSNYKSSIFNQKA